MSSLAAALGTLIQSRWAHGIRLAVKRTTRLLAARLLCGAAMLMSVTAAWADQAPTANVPADACAGRGAGVQGFDGVCLPDRLVGYLKCVEKLGGNRLRVTT